MGHEEANGAELEHTFILPQFAAHMNSPASHIYTRFDKSSLTEKLLISVILGSGPVAEMHLADPDLLQKCTLRAMPRSEQKTWPLVTVYTNDGLQLPSRSSLPLVQHNLTQSLTSHERFSSINHVVLGPTQIDSLCDEEERKARYRKQTNTGEPTIQSFVEVQAFAMMLGGAVKMATSPIMDGITGDVGKNTEVDTRGLMVPNANANVPTQVMELAERPMRVNISNLMVDAVIYKLANVLSDSLTNAMAPPIEEALADLVIPKLHQNLQPVLTEVLDEDLVKNLPPLLERILNVNLPPLLTDTLAHAIVPSLSQATAHTADQDYFCHACYWQQMYCSRCRFSRQEGYYASYYAAYYTDYYSNYYRDYYLESMMLQDELLNPGQLSAKTHVGG